MARRGVGAWGVGRRRVGRARGENAATPGREDFLYLLLKLVRLWNVAGGLGGFPDQFVVIDCSKERRGRAGEDLAGRI